MKGGRGSLSRWYSLSQLIKWQLRGGFIRIYEKGPFILGDDKPVEQNRLEPILQKLSAQGDESEES